jgi:ethanolamine utilization cobalamin adenosyltransferase
MLMDVLTEAALRILLKDEDLDAMKEYRVDADVIVTPSAKAYLIDHRIDLVTAKKRAIKTPDADRRERQRDAGEISARRQRAGAGGGPDGGAGAKPEHMTALRGETLVFKDHKIICLRGKIDSLEAKTLETQLAFLRHGCRKAAGDLGETLDCLRRIMRAEVLDEPLPPLTLFGLDEAEIRDRSHNPQKYYGVPHFMPATANDGEVVLMLNCLRALAREAELVAYEAFRGESGAPERADIILAFNRLSSAFYVMMLRSKAGEYDTEAML